MTCKTQIWNKMSCIRMCSERKYVLYVILIDVLAFKTLARHCFRHENSFSYIFNTKSDGYFSKTRFHFSTTFQIFTNFSLSFPFRACIFDFKII